MDETVDEIYEKVMNSGVYERGFEQGFKLGFERRVKQGELNMAIRFKQVLGIDEACRISGFSKEELENEVLNEYD